MVAMIVNAICGQGCRSKRGRCVTGAGTWRPQEGADRWQWSHHSGLISKSGRAASRTRTCDCLLLLSSSPKVCAWAFSLCYACAWKWLFHGALAPFCISVQRIGDVMCHVLLCGTKVWGSSQGCSPYIAPDMCGAVSATYGLAPMRASIHLHCSRLSAVFPSLSERGSFLVNYCSFLMCCGFPRHFPSPWMVKTCFN